MPEIQHILRGKASVLGSQRQGNSKLLATFYDNAGTTASFRSAKTTVSLVDTQTYKEVVSGADNTSFQSMHGADLSDIFFPYEVVSPDYNTGGSGITMNTVPQVGSGVFVLGSGHQTYQIVAADIFPVHIATSGILNYSGATSGDSIKSIITGGVNYYLGDNIRDLQRARGIGFKTPMVVTGWGFTTEGFPAPHDGDSTPGCTFPGGSGVTGRDVDPTGYIAAPLDLRYDEAKEVWTTDNGFRIVLANAASGSGIYLGKTLSGVNHDKSDGSLIIDDLGQQPIDEQDNCILYDASMVGLNALPCIRIGYNRAERKEILFPLRTSVHKWFRVVSSTQDGTNKRWTYTCKKITKATGGYGGWDDDTIDTADYTLYNGIDDSNGASGTFGSGINSGNLSGTFSHVPLGAGAKVRAVPVQVESTGETEWWIDVVLQVDGTCL